MNKLKNITKLSWCLAVLVAAMPLATQAAVDFRFYGPEGLGGFNIGGSGVADLTGDDQYPDEPSVIETVTGVIGEAGVSAIDSTTGNFEWPQTVGGNGEPTFQQGDTGLNDYGIAVSGLIYVPVTGSYTFHVRSDDSSQFWLSDDEDRGGLELMAEEPGCCNGFTKDAPRGSAAVDLEVGKAYYFEYLFKEGGGGDWFQVGWALNGGDINVIPTAYLQRDISSYVSGMPAFTPSEGLITTPNEFSDLFPFIPERGSIDLVAEFDFDGVATIQWQVSSGGAFRDIEGANSPILTVEGDVANDGNEYRVKINDETSEAYELTVEADEEAPTVKSVGHRGNPNALIVKFSEAVVAEQALDASNYVFDGGALPDGTTLEFLDDSNTEVLILGGFDMQLGDRLSLAVSGINDLAASPNEVEGFAKTVAYIGGEGITYDFNDGVPTDDNGNPIMELYGVAEVRDTGGVGDSGYLKITDGAGSQLGAALITERLDVTQVVFKFDARIGDTSGRPADGWSFNVADDMPTGTYQQSEEGYRGGETTPPQGLVVSADNWSSGGQDLGVGIEIKFKGESRAFVATPEVTAGGAPTESAEGIPSIHRGNRWFPVSVDMREDGTATVDYDSVRIMDAIQVGWDGISDAQVGFGARTGGAWESHWFDNVNLNFSGGPVGPITIDEQPSGSSDVPEHDPVGLSVVPGGATFGQTFQWYKVGGGSIAGNISGISETGGDVSINYTGSLQSAPSVNGPWSDVASSATETTHTEAASDDAKFFRVQAAAGGGGEDTMIEGATSSSFGQTAAPSVAGQYYVIAKNWFSEARSETVTISVVPDTEAPTIASVSGAATQNVVSVEFSEPVDSASATDPANYSIEGPDGALAIESIAANGDSGVIITTATQADASKYTVKATGVMDQSEAGNASDDMGSFVSFQLRQGGLSVLFYNGGGNLNFYPVDDRGLGLYPSGFQPYGTGSTTDDIRARRSTSTTYWEAPSSGDISVRPPGDVSNNYNTVMFGFIRPEETGSYIFGVAVDDNAELYLSTDDDPSNSALIASEPSWNQIREYEKPENQSPVIDLEGGENYYVELLTGEGGGGDNAAVAWTFDADGNPEPVAQGQEPIPANFLWGYHPAFEFATVLQASPGDGATGVFIDSTTVSFQLRDGIAEVVDAETVKLSIGGAEVDATVEKNGDTTSVSYTGADMYAQGADIEVMVSFNGDKSRTWSFSTESLTSLTHAAPLGNGGDSGMLVSARQGTDADGNGRANNTDAAEAQLAEDGAWDSPEFEADDVVVDYINHNQDVGGGAGRFGDDQGMVEAGLMSEANTDNLAWSVIAYVEFPAGPVTMTVNSDDGFRVTHGEDPAISDDDIELGVFSGGRGASDTTFRFMVPEAGIYPLRLLWYEGGGGANVEWWTQDSDGVRHLINGPDDADAFPSYQDATGVTSVGE